MTYSLIIISMLLFAVGFAHGGEALVKVRLKSSFTIDGKTYHPHSKGTLVPQSLAKAIGVEILPSEPEQVQEPEGEDLPEADPEGSAGLPEGFPERELLLKNGLETINQVASHPDLTQIKGIGKATRDKILQAIE